MKDKKSPKVSICIPAYKQPELLDRALKSITIQDFNDYEVIITDDSPDDQIKELLTNSFSDMKIRYFKNQDRQGSPGNWNEAIRHAVGEYVKILHHDDWFIEESSLSKFVDLLDKNPDADFAFSGSKNFDYLGRVRYEHFANQDQVAKLIQDPTYICLGNFIGAPSATIYRRKINQEFDINLKWLVDIEFYANILLSNARFAYTTDLLVGILDLSPDRVTAESLGNKQVEVYEYVYLYEKIKQRVGTNFPMFRHMWHLFERFSITSRYELLSFGIKEPIPLEAINILRFQGIFRVFSRGVDTVKKLFSIRRWARLILIHLSYIFYRILNKK